MKIAALQMNIEWHDREANFLKVALFAEKARATGAETLILPEMFSTGFSMDLNATSEPIDGPAPSFMRRLARDLDMGIVGGFALRKRCGGTENVALAVDRRGADLALYAKIHQIALLGEEKSYKPGKKPAPFGMGGFGAACFICYDLRFPELFRTVVDKCGLIIVIASWPSTRQAHWDILLKARAVESQSFIVGVNRIGEGGGHSFSGGTAIIDPSGEIIAVAGDSETLVTATIYPDTVSCVRAKMPFLVDRKPWLLKT